MKFVYVLHWLFYTFDINSQMLKATFNLTLCSWPPSYIENEISTTKSIQRAGSFQQPWQCVCFYAAPYVSSPMRGFLSGTHSVSGWVAREQSRGRVLNRSARFHFLNQTRTKRAGLCTCERHVDAELSASIVPCWRRHKFVLLSFSCCLYQPSPLITETV